jgi:putative transposase
LPDHLHAIWTLPPDDADFASRWSQIKSGFSRELPVAQLRSGSQMVRREMGIWQRWFWEHAVRNDAENDMLPADLGGNLAEIEGRFGE